jgi:hypothetical protein
MSDWTSPTSRAADSAHARYARASPRRSIVIAVHAAIAATPLAIETSRRYSRSCDERSPISDCSAARCDWIIGMKSAGMSTGRTRACAWASVWNPPRSLSSSADVDSRSMSRSGNDTVAPSGSPTARRTWSLRSTDFLPPSPTVPASAPSSRVTTSVPCSARTTAMATASRSRGSAAPSSISASQLRDMPLRSARMACDSPAALRAFRSRPPNPPTGRVVAMPASLSTG